MLSLIETIIGFASIMLMLSLLVKSLTSVLKNTFDYYCSNLEYEVKRLVREALNKTWEELVSDSDVQTRASWLRDLQWNRLGDNFLTADNMRWLLKQLDPNKHIPDLEARVALHLSKLQYAFEMRMKNLALAAGLALCLFFNINSFTIWKSLYTDQQLRATFSDHYAKQAVDLAARENGITPAADNSKAVDQPPATTPAEQQQKIASDAKAFQTSMHTFLSDVSFGIGYIWKARLVTGDKASSTSPKQPGAAGNGGGRSENEWGPGWIFAYEFFGSLLTGILVSIGAPYWHDLLQALASLRPDKADT
jgi:hypothetical protein